MASTKGGKDWAENRKYYGFVRKKMWRHFRERHMDGSNVLRLLALMAPRQLARLADSLADVEAQFKARFPFEVRLVAGCTEDLRTADGLEEADAKNRIHQYMAEYTPSGLNFLKYGPFTAYATSAERHLRDLGIPLFYGNPHPNPAKGDPDVWQRVLDLAPSKTAHPFHATLSGPWKYWIDRHIRDMCGEVRDPETEDLLLLDGGRYSYGSLWGFHPNLECGEPEGLEEMAGQTPIDYFINNRIMEARLCLMGIAGRCMDDMRLHAIDGPVIEFKEGKERPVYPKRGRLGRAQRHRNGYIIARLSWKGIEPTLVGKKKKRRRDKDWKGFGHAIARRVQTQYYADHPDERAA